MSESIERTNRSATQNDLRRIRANPTPGMNEGMRIGCCNDTIDEEEEEEGPASASEEPIVPFENCFSDDGIVLIFFTTRTHMTNKK